MARAAQLGYFGHTGHGVPAGGPLDMSCRLVPYSVSVCPSVWGEASCSPLEWVLGICGLLWEAQACRRSLWALVSHPCPCGRVTPIVWVDLVTLCPVKQGVPLLLRVADKCFWN